MFFLKKTKKTKGNKKKRKSMHDMVKPELRGASCKLRVTSYELKT